MNRIKKITIAFVLSFGVVLFCLISSQRSSNTVHAQSDANINSCTYYSSNGFKSHSSCEKWLRWKSANERKRLHKWFSKGAKKVLKDTDKKTGTCLAVVGIANSPSIVKSIKKTVKSKLKSAKGIKTVAIQYGLDYIACIFS